MNDLIYRDDLYKKLREEHDAHKAIWGLYHHDIEQGGICLGLSYAIMMLSKQHTVEAELVRHGRWINDTFCSECNRFPVDVSVSISNQELTKHFSRCPHCGAKMDAEVVLP